MRDLVVLDGAWHRPAHLDPDGAQEGLLADCPPDVADRAVALLRPEDVVDLAMAHR